MHGETVFHLVRHLLTFSFFSSILLCFSLIIFWTFLSFNSSTAVWSLFFLMLHSSLVLFLSLLFIYFIFLGIFHRLGSPHLLWLNWSRNYYFHQVMLPLLVPVTMYPWSTPLCFMLECRYSDFYPTCTCDSGSQRPPFILSRLRSPVFLHVWSCPLSCYLCILYLLMLIGQLPMRSVLLSFFFFFGCTRSVFKRTFEETTVFNFKFAMCFCSRDVGRVDIG